MKKAIEEDLNNPVFRQKIFDARVIDIVKGWQESPHNVTEISLESTGISDDSLHEIVNFLLRPDCKIEKLNLSNNPNITDDGLRKFVEVVKHNKSLKELDISNNYISAYTAGLLSNAIFQNKKSQLEQIFFFSDLDPKEANKIDEIADKTTTFLVGRNSEQKVDRVLPIRLISVNKNKDNQALIKKENSDKPSSDLDHNNSPSNIFNNPSIRHQNIHTGRCRTI